MVALTRFLFLIFKFKKDLFLPFENWEKLVNCNRCFPQFIQHFYPQKQHIRPSDVLKIVMCAYKNVTLIHTAGQITGLVLRTCSFFRKVSLQCP